MYLQNAYFRPLQLILVCFILHYSLIVCSCFNIRNLIKLYPSNFLQNCCASAYSCTNDNGRIFTITADSANQDCVLPSVIVWHPELDLNTISCPNCYDTSLSLEGWTHSRSYWTPRLVFGRNEQYIFITTIYRCCSCHKRFRGYDNHFLNQNEKKKLPCILGHSSGITVDLEDQILAMYYQSSSFSEITRVIETQYQSRLCRLGTFRSTETDLESFLKSTPSRKFITQIIASHETKLHTKYIQKINSNTAAEWISMNHTFKVPRVARRLLGRSWKEEYASLFIVLNEHGQVSFYTG